MLHERRYFFKIYHILNIWHFKKKKMGRKIIHVHFLASHKNYYFGSVSAVYKMFTAQDLGINESYLRHILTEDGNHHLTDKVLIIRSRLLV